MRAPAPRDVAELLSALGHAGTAGRRPRVLEGTIVSARGQSDTEALVSIHGADPVSLPVSFAYRAQHNADGSWGPQAGHEVKIEAVQYDLHIRGQK